jgi:hypothetical protein
MYCRSGMRVPGGAAQDPGRREGAAAGSGAPGGGAWVRVRAVVTAICCTLAVGAGLVAVPPARAAVPQDRVVSADPVNWTPHVLYGRVKAIAQVGNTIVLGGAFTQARGAKDATVLPRRNLLAFDATTGAVSTTFVPTVDGQVEALAAAPDGRSVFVGGSFRTVNGAASKGLARLDVTSGQAVAGFSAPVDGGVLDLDVRGDRLYVGGGFGFIRGVRRGALARVDVNTGAVDPAFDVPFTGLHSGGTTRVLEQEISRDGTRLVAIGNFTAAGGQPRSQLAVLDVAAAPATVAGWSTARYEPQCPTRALGGGFDTYLRDVDIAPDGTYFAVVTTGAWGGTSTLCDSTARWELLPTAGPGQQPTWVDFTGGDTLLSVAVTGTAVYVGGHQQYHNSALGPVPPNGSSTVPAGAVARSGIAALDPYSGVPLTWNPGRTRGQGAYELLATDDGLWVTSDTDRIGNWEFHGRVAKFPLAGGTPNPPTAPAVLPNDLHAVGVAPDSPDALVRRRFDGAAVGAGTVVSGPPLDGGRWSGVRGTFMLNGELYAGWADGQLRVIDFDGTRFSGAWRTVDLYGLGAVNFPVASITGMFFSPPGFLYFTIAGSPYLWVRRFSPESGILGPDAHPISGGGDGCDWSRTRGATLASGRIYFAATFDGNLYGLDFVNGRPVCRSTLVAGPGKGDGTDWRSTRGMFVLHGPGGAPAGG